MCYKLTLRKLKTLKSLLWKKRNIDRREWYILVGSKKYFVNETCKGVFKIKAMDNKN